MSPVLMSLSDLFAIDLFAVHLFAVDLFAVGDPGATRTVLAAIAFLVAIGVGLLVLAGWLIRATRADPEVLAPLELMGERTWRRSDPVWQRRRLDEVRPGGAEPLDPMAPPPDRDDEFDLGPRLGDFSDFDDLLRTLGVALDDASPDQRGDADMGPPPDAPEVVEVVGDDAADGRDETAPVELDRYDEGHGNAGRRRDDRPVP